MECDGGRRKGGSEGREGVMMYVCSLFSVEGRRGVGPICDTCTL